MVGGGLMQLIAYGAQDIFFTATYRRHATFSTESIDGTCYKTIPIRKYNNFELIFDDKKIGKEYYSNELINIYSINISELNNKSILVNSEKISKINKEKLIKIIKKEKKEKVKEKDIYCDNSEISFYKSTYSGRNTNRDFRFQKKVQDRQMKQQMKRR